jgi:hypothetical protein
MAKATVRALVRSIYRAMAIAQSTDLTIAKATFRLMARCTGLGLDQ